VSPRLEPSLHFPTLVRKITRRIRRNHVLFFFFSPRDKKLLPFTAFGKKEQEGVQRDTKNQQRLFPSNLSKDE